MNQLVRRFVRCPEERIVWENFGRVNIHKLNNVSECNDIGFPQCDNSTCYNANISNCIDGGCLESHVICTSYCDDEELCKGVFQCSDNRLIFYSQFCDGIVDCFDGSDEITKHPGFKCKKCILPQSNLYDDLAHCDNGLDLCLAGSSCFQCFDNRLLILAKQVCDGVTDCFDLSDECLCEEYFDSEMCKINNITFGLIPSTRNQQCKTKFSVSILSNTCDGRPECKDYSDECECPNPPSYCNDSCHTYFPMGDRYCDGVEDHAWQYINKTSCPRGFDELFCPKRFRCHAAGKVSIDVQKVCDGTADCDDDSDEQDCPARSNIQNVFSSDTEMIANAAIKSAFWIIGFVVIIGNTYVIITSIARVKTTKSSDGVRLQHFIILNISFADFIMGIYLFTIACFSASFSGIYGLVDDEWRSSFKCSIIGNLAVLSSETSCFLMLVLTAFRLKNITQTYKSMHSSLLLWKILIGAAWMLSFTLSILPILNVTSQYFLHSFSYSSNFQNGVWYISKFQQFISRYSGLRNTTVNLTENNYLAMASFVQSSLSVNESINLFGYYGQTSVCMPRFYALYGKNTWLYSFSIVTLNFFSFFFVAVCYIIMYKHSTASSANLRSSRSSKQSTTMQKRIARIIATDFCCWIPICIMTWVRLGVEFSDIAYQISAVLLLPVNSAMNPFLFTPLPDKLINFFRHKHQDMKQITGKNDAVRKKRKVFT